MAGVRHTQKDKTFHEAFRSIVCRPCRTYRMIVYHSHVLCSATYIPNPSSACCAPIAGCSFLAIHTYGPLSSDTYHMIPPKYPPAPAPPPFAPSYLCVREYEAHVRRPSGQQQRPHRRGLPHADGADLRPDVLHRVVDRQASRDYAARAEYIR